MLVVSCSAPKELSREKAIDAIRRGNPVHPVLAYHGLGVLDCLKNAGALTWGGFIVNVWANVTPKGHSFIDRVDVRSTGLGEYYEDVHLKHAVPVQIVEITGITSDTADASGSIKHVDYKGKDDFSSASLPPGALNCLDGLHGEAFQGTATLRLYDDGWRLQTILTPTIDTPKSD